MRTRAACVGLLVVAFGLASACSNGSDGSDKRDSGSLQGGHSSTGSNQSSTSDASGGDEDTNFAADGGAVNNGSSTPATSAAQSNSGGASASAGKTSNGGAGNSGGTQAASTDNANVGGTSTSVGGSKSSVGGTRSATGGTKATASGTASATGGTSTKSSAGGTGAGTTSMPTSAADCRKEGDGKTTLVFVNSCSKPVTYRGSDITGGTLAAGAFACVDVGTATEAISSKRYWGWIGADPGAEHHSLAEFTFNTDFYEMDWYNISYVDAHNLPLAILPAARPKCRQLSCPQDFLSTCPAAGQYRDADGNLAACVSPNRDDPKNAVVLLFEQCDDAYAWSADDQNGTDKSPMIGCEVEDFDIVFCPGAV